MKTVTFVESGTLPSDGSVVYRWRCNACGCRGIWLGKLGNAEANAQLHARAQHAERSVA